MKKRRKMWGGRFKTATHPLVEEFTASLPFDQRLYRYDITGSIAWAGALARAKVITHQEMQKIVKGLNAVRRSIDDRKARFLSHDEDIHMAVERLLTQRIGPVGGKLHTGRSRNDQVALDLRLYLRDEIRSVLSAIKNLQGALLAQARQHLDIVMPGYTHLQRAQPILLSHHLMAYVEMLERDRQRLMDAFRRTNVMPLGSGALAGSNFAISRERIAKALGFDKVTQNSLDAVSDRDFIIEFLAASTLLMVHLSRLSEELVLWSTEEFGFVEIPDAFCTGSSLMPQKKNPDVLELIRAKTGRVFGHLTGLLTTLKALPLAYNRDLQEDKEPLFDTIDTIKPSLAVLAEVLKALKIKKDALYRSTADGFLLSTDLADYLVLKGLPFRKAHEVVGRIVRYCLDRQRDLTALSVPELKRFSPLVQKDVFEYLTVSGSLDRKCQTGATARRQVLRQIARFQRNGKKG
jgi:argininosuccinate lyase